MASSPAIDKLFQFVERYDLEELLEAASSSEHWKVISVEEKKHIESQGSKQKRREHLASLIAADGKRVSTFANFILRYNRAVQDAALAVLSTEPRQKESPCKFPRHFSVEQCSSQSGQKLSTCSASPMDVDTCNTELSVLDHPLKASLMADSRARLIFCGAGCSEADAVCHCEMHNYSECHTGSSRLNSVSDSLGSSSNSMDTGDPKSGLITHDLNFGPHVSFMYTLYTLLCFEHCQAGKTGLHEVI